MTTYTSIKLFGPEQEEAVNAVLKGNVKAITFESIVAVDSFFSKSNKSSEKRELVRAMDDLVVRAQNTVVADALKRYGVDAWVPDVQDLEHLYA